MPPQPASGRSPLAPRGWWLVVPAAAFMALFFVWPTLALMARGAEAVGTGTMPWSRVSDAVATTVMLASAGTVLTLVCGVPATWALFRRTWRGSRVALALATVPFVLPTVVVASAFRAATRDATWAQAEAGIAATIVAALVFFNIAVVVRIVGPVWAGLDDRTYWAARTLGASPWRAFVTVRLPALAPAVAAATATVWLFCSTSFGVVIVLGGGRIATVDTEVWLQTQHFLNLSAAAVLGIVQILMVATTFGVATWLGRRVRGGAARRSRQDAPTVRGWRDGITVVAALAPAALVFALPMVALLARSLWVRGTVSLGNFSNLFSQANVAGSGGSAGDALAMSLGTALVVAVLATSLALAVATFIASRPGMGWLHGFMLLPLGVSSVVVGLGMVLTLARPVPGLDFVVDPRLLVPLAHTVIALPLATSVVLPAFRAIDGKLLAAAATLGAAPARVWTSIQWPLVRRAAFMAAGLSAAVSLGEFGASAFLARPGGQTLPTLMFRLLGRPGPENLGMALAAAVLLAVLTAAVAIAADHRRLSLGGRA